MAKDNAIQVKIIISYSDGLRWYETGVCLSHLRFDNATSYCRTDNYMK